MPNRSPRSGEVHSEFNTLLDCRRIAVAPLDHSHRTVWVRVLMSLANGWVAVVDLNQSPITAPRAVEVSGEEIVLFKHGERYVAMGRWCPHQNADMVRGRIFGTSVKCPLHGFMFNVDHGRCVNARGYSLPVHEVKVEDGILSVRLAPATEGSSEGSPPD